MLFRLQTKHVPTGDQTSFEQSFASKEAALEHCNLVNALHMNIIQGKFITWINPEDLNGTRNR